MNIEEYIWQSELFKILSELVSLERPNCFCSGYVFVAVASMKKARR